MVLVVGASNQWFAQSLSALAVPQVGAIALQAKVEQLWDDLQNIREPAVLDFAWTLPAFQALHQWSKEEVFEAIARHHKTLESGPKPDPGAYPDLRTPEQEMFSSTISSETIRSSSTQDIFTPWYSLTGHPPSAGRRRSTARLSAAARAAAGRGRRSPGGGRRGRSRRRSRTPSG